MNKILLLKIVLSFIFYIFLWAPFLSPIFVDGIRESRYVVYGGEGVQFLAAILQSVIFVAGMAPLFWFFVQFWAKKRKAGRDSPRTSRPWCCSEKRNKRR